MADTQRTKTDLITNLYQDGQAAGSISAQDHRDLIVSMAYPFGGLYFSTPAATTIGVATTYYKAAGTTTTTNLANVDTDGGTNNRLRYTGVPDRHFHIVSQASVTLSAGAGQDIGIQVWHYDASGASGTLLAHSQARNTIATTNVEQITTHADVMMSTNDYIEMHIANHTGTNNVTVSFGYIFMVGMFM